MHEVSRTQDRTIGQRVGTEESDIDVQILQASAAGNVAALREWFSRLGTSPDARDRFTRIFLATISEAPDESLNLFFSSGLVDVHAEDDINERNCLHEAAIYGKENVLYYALENGVDLTRSDAYGRVPLHYACLKGRIAMVERLLQVGPNTIDLKDHDNFTPLIHSIVRHRVDCVRLLIANNARIDPQSDTDHIPLNLACQHESIEVTTLLLERNARLLADTEGLFPQHLVARSSQRPDLLLLLRQHGADLNQRDKLYQWTPLFHAASEGRVECLRTLLESGADPKALDEKGLTAMYYATWEGHLECMDLLWQRTSEHRAEPRSSTGLGVVAAPQTQMLAMEITPEEPRAMEADGIPDLSLPPPIMPLRRYGHSFLDTKAFIAINFDRAAKAIQFFNEARYPAARLTISSKTSDLIPRNLMLPIQEDTRSVYLQVENLSSFSLDFEIFPTFGSKVIAKSVALPDVFQAVESSAGSCCLPLFDPRLRSVGQIQFNFQVIKPYPGRTLEITQFPSYWRQTSALDDQGGSMTGSSLSGDYLKITVQLTRDVVPVIYPSYFVRYHGLEVSLCQLKFGALAKLGATGNLLHRDGAPALESVDIMDWKERLSKSIFALRDVLAAVPIQLNLNLHILYPSDQEDANLGVYSNTDINTFADAILTEVFDHARAMRFQSLDHTLRSIVFSSFNPNICTALNWKQPNYPILLCNDLGRLQDTLQSPSSVLRLDPLRGTSLKETARLSQMNNFMGLTCSTRILQMVPALTETIKQAGLVLVSDASAEDGSAPNLSTEETGFAMKPDGVSGVMKANGILRFNETVDM